MQNKDDTFIRHMKYCFVNENGKYQRRFKVIAYHRNNGPTNTKQRFGLGKKNFDQTGIYLECSYNFIDSVLNCQDL